MTSTKEPDLLDKILDDALGEATDDWERGYPYDWKERYKAEILKHYIPISEVKKAAKNTMLPLSKDEPNNDWWYGRGNNSACREILIELDIAALNIGDDND
jgi:hypothetical protein